MRLKITEAFAGEDMTVIADERSVGPGQLIEIALPKERSIRIYVLGDDHPTGEAESVRATIIRAK